MKNNRDASREFKRIIECAAKGIPVYVKDTGIKVIITRLEKNNFGYRRSRTLNNLYCSIKFIDPPSYKALRMCGHYDLRCDEGPRGMSQSSQPSTFYPFITATIKVINLKSSPYESKASKILFSGKVK